MEQIVRRTCSNCVAFDNGECLNGLGDVEPGDCCATHETVADYEADVAALQRFRVAIGLAPRPEGAGPC